jgi:hypothetical protein
MRAAQQMEAAFGFYMQRGQSAASVERLTLVQAQPQDSSAPRASKVARGDQVISQRLPSGSAMNAERPPQDRSVASATGVAPAAKAAAKAVELLSSTDRAGQRDARPSRRSLSGGRSLRGQVGQREERQQDAAKEKAGPRVVTDRQLPPAQRTIKRGMSTTFQNAAMVLSIGIFFSLIITGLARSMPQTLTSGLVAQGVPASAAARLAALPPVSVLFASLLGYSPIELLLGPGTLGDFPPDHAAYLTGRSFFLQLISGSFADGLAVAFGFAIAACLVAALVWVLRGGKYVHTEPPAAVELIGSEQR